MQSLANMYEDQEVGIIGGNSSSSCPPPPPVPEYSYNNFLQQVLMSCSSASSSMEVFNSIQNHGNNLVVSMADAKVAAANKSHSEAERRRRKRINGHLATLRTLLPNTIKSDKASLLAEVVRCIRELKKTTADIEVAGKGDEDDDPYADEEFISNVFPGESDELKLSYAVDVKRQDNNNNNNKIIKATICCEDRPEIMLEMTRALESVEAKVVKAEMSTVGGRTKTVLWVEVSGGRGGGGGGEGLLATLRRALKAVVDKSILLPVGGGNKRPRLYHC